MVKSTVRCSSKQTVPAQRHQGPEARSDSFRQLHDEFSTQLERWLRRRTFPPLDSDALLQEVWRRVWTNLDSVEVRNPLAWLITIAKRVQLDALRRIKGEVKAMSVKADQLTAQERLISNPKLDALEDCLQRIDSHGVKLIKARLLGIPDERSAQLCELSRESIYQLVRRGKAQLRRCIESKLAHE